jgi:formylglycine-generating enzyme required for sulfatase activity
MPETLPPPSGNARSRDHIFVSYAHTDRALVERLAEDLRGRGYTVWIDFDGIRGGDIWRQAIVDGIHASAVVLVMLSPDSVVSEWVKLEVEAALAFGKTMIPLLVRPLKTDEAQAGYQALGIAHIQYRDFTLGYEAGFRELLKDLPKPKAGIAGHCQKIAARLAAQPWGLDHYIQEEARLLPIHASPYEEGARRSERQNLLHTLRTHRRTLVLGEPGMGKSVVLERLAWELATSDPPIVPVIIKLMDYDGKPLLEWVRLALNETGEFRLNDDEKAKHFLLESGHKFYFLFDGLNEVPLDHRNKIASELVRLSMDFSSHSLVMTSRVQDETWRRLRGGNLKLDSTAVIQPIQPEDSLQYLKSHLGEMATIQLWSGLDPRMQGLAAIPLLLWLIKEAWLEATQDNPQTMVRIPENRGELYQNFVTRMLRRDDERGLAKNIPENERLLALERLAWTMNEKQQVSISYDHALTIIGSRDVLEAILINGLLIGDKQLRFAPHQTTQEYFAASGLHRRAFAIDDKKMSWNEVIDPRTGDSVLRNARDSWWWETFIQLAGITDDPNSLAIALAEANPWVAWWCVQEGKRVDDATRAAIARRTEALVDSPDAKDRQNVAQVLIQLKTQRKKEFLTRLCIDNDTETSFIALSGLLEMDEDGAQVINELIPNVLSTLPIRHRAEWMQRIAVVDRRQGVGLINDIPDIDWCDPISPGPFLYGDNNRSETIDHAYQISRYPVTNAQFSVFVADPQGYNNREWWTEAGWSDKGGRKAPDEHKDARFRLPNHPRIYVTWYEAVAFCNWLTAKLNPQVWAQAREAIHDGDSSIDLSSIPGLIRLPTEREWERAARGMDGRAYPYEGEFDAGKGNVYETGIGRTSAVGIFPEGRSSCGTLDMSGNVWEWCLTVYHTRNDAINGTDVRVLRGGSWYSNQGLARAVYRLVNHPASRFSNIGLRVVAVGVPSQKL